MIICFPHKPGNGGPGSFQTRFERSLKLKGWTICYKGDSIYPDLIFVVGGTKSILWLLKMKLRGVPILYRLDGISWLHRVRKVGLKQKILGEYRNLNNKLIHCFLADKIVYQSEFVKKWWDKDGLRKRKDTSIIYNGVPLNDEKSGVECKNKCNRLVVLEGTIDYSPYSIKLLNDLSCLLPLDFQIELYGDFEIIDNKNKLNKRIEHKGFITREQVNAVFNNSIYLSLDVNPACPNTVVEALSSGAPVVAFDTGSLIELVVNESGIVVAYGSDPWKLGYPDVRSLAKAVLEVGSNYQYYSNNARKLAVKKYTLESMTQKYSEIITEMADI